MVKKTAKNYVTNKKSLIRKLIIVLLIGTISGLVYASGGTRTSMTHLMYIPIGIAAFYFDVKETMITALLSGLALGPLMPAFVSMEIMQISLNWLFRIAMFMGIGLVLALLFRRVKKLKEAEIEKSFHHAITGLPNTYKLKLDLEKLIEQKTDLALVGFKIVNIGDINRYINYDIGVKSLLKAIEALSELVNRPVYSIFDDEFAVILPHTAPDQAYAVGLKFLNKLKDPFSISRCKIELIVNGGIVNFPNQAKTADDLIKKMDIALDEEKGQEKLVVYDNLIEQKNKEIYNLMVSLFDAIKSEEFYVVYQPQISVTDHAMTGVEALLRWNHQDKGLINPERFINLAEKMGIVSEITKFLIRTVLIQIKQWQQEGLSLKVALNISSQDLKEDSVIDYLKKSLEENGLNPSMIELELTERSIVKNKAKTLQLLNSLRDYGIKISLDDCGTGYNSLINFISLPIDNLKIDKTFIDDITVDNNKKLIIESIIRFAQKTGKKVIAEGVETKQQCDLLAAMGCDYIQGYYFSKPLPPELVKAYTAKN